MQNQPSLVGKWQAPLVLHLPASKPPGSWQFYRMKPEHRAGLGPKVELGKCVKKNHPIPNAIQLLYRCSLYIYISGGDPKSYMTIKPVGPDSSINISSFFRRIREFSLQCRNTSHECGAGPEGEHESISFLEVRAHSMVLRSFVAWKLKKRLSTKSQTNTFLDCGRLREFARN